MEIGSRATRTSTRISTLGVGVWASGRRRATAAFPLHIKHNVSIYQKFVCAIDVVSRRSAVRKQKPQQGGMLAFKITR
jgi:hypothetical protein